MQKVIDWDTYFMALSHISAFRSKDPSTQVGAIIVDENHRIVSMGYNGMPSGIDESQFPWGREGSFLDSKYAYVVHAELNAILNASRSVRGCTLYVSLFPCNECAKAIIQSGIREVVYESDKYANADNVIASKKLLAGADIKVRPLGYTVNVEVNVDQQDGN